MNEPLAQVVERAYDQALAKAMLVELGWCKTQLRSRADGAWPRHVVNEVEVEYRRLLALQMCHPDHAIVAQGAVAEFARVHARDPHQIPLPDGLSPVGAVGSTDSDAARAETANLYQLMFGRPMPKYWMAGEDEDYLSAEPGVVG